MFRVRFVCLLLALLCLLGAGTHALAAETDCDSAYCFTTQDFSLSDEPLAGICITELPRQSGTVLLGSRILQPGDILTADQIAQMTFSPLQTQEDSQAVISYLPIFSDRVEQPATMTLSIRGKEDKSPVAQDSTVETYKNLPNDGQLKVSDPEGHALTYTLVRAPRRGEVVIHENGSFTYTPKKNKVGVDSFTYTAADPAGNVSREATVTVQILKPTDARQYTDTAGLDCQFEAEWLRNTGLFVGENVNGENCFLPEKAVTRGEFLAMLVKTLDIPAEESSSVIAQDTPDWLKPYLTAAMRAGLMDRLPEKETGAWDLQQPICGAEAAVMVQNALALSVSEESLETDTPVMQENDAVPAWAATSLTILADNGIHLPPMESLSRGDIACLLYQTGQLALDAPGMAVFRMQ